MTSVQVVVKFSKDELDRIGAAEYTKLSDMKLDDGFVVRLRYLKAVGWSYRRIALLTGNHHSAVCCWSKGEYLPRDAQTRMLIYQVCKRVRERIDQGPAVAIN